MNKKHTTRATIGVSGIAALVLITAIADADSIKYLHIEELNTGMEEATITALGAIAGEIIEAEFERDDGRSIWEIEIVSATNQVTEVKVDANTGEILGTEIENGDFPDFDYQVNLEKALNIIQSVEQGALIEAELEDESGDVFWE